MGVPAPLHAVGTMPGRRCGNSSSARRASCARAPAAWPSRAAPVAPLDNDGHLAPPTLRWALGRAPTGPRRHLPRPRVLRDGPRYHQAVGTSGQPATDLPTRHALLAPARSQRRGRRTRRRARRGSSRSAPARRGRRHGRHVAGVRRRRARRTSSSATRATTATRNGLPLLRWEDGRRRLWLVEPPPHAVRRRFGGLLASLGTINGDSFADLAANSLGLGPPPRAGGPTCSLAGRPSAPNPATVLTATGAVAVASAGDANGDGFADLVAVDSGATPAAWGRRWHRARPRSRCRRAATP